MSIVDHHGEVEYPFSQKTVFKAILEAASKISGLSIDSADEISGRVTFKAGVSLVSWGENIPVQLSKISDNRTLMKIMSTPKTGLMGGGAFDFGKNQQNIDNIINAVSSVLSTYPKETEKVDSSTTIDQLSKLGELKAQGVLSDEEFEEQKKKVIEGKVENKALNNNILQQPYTPTPTVNIEGTQKNNATKYAVIFGIVFLVLFLLFTLAEL